jgi:hypothetical protein
MISVYLCIGVGLSRVGLLNGTGTRIARERPHSRLREADHSYDGLVVGEFSADKLVGKKVIVEEKAVQSLVSPREF